MTIYKSVIIMGDFCENFNWFQLTHFIFSGGYVLIYLDP